MTKYRMQVYVELMRNDLHNELFAFKKQGESFQSIKRKLYDDERESLVGNSVEEKVLKHWDGWGIMNE